MIEKLLLDIKTDFWICLLILWMKVFFFLITDLKRKLAKFVQEETEKIQDGEASEAIKRVKTGVVDINKLVDRWTQAFTQVGYLC